MAFPLLWDIGEPDGPMTWIINEVIQDYSCCVGLVPRVSLIVVGIKVPDDGDILAIVMDKGSH